MQKASTSRGASANLVGFSAAGKGYAITGDYAKQFLMFDPIKIQWIIEPYFPGGEHSQASGFVINDELYFGAGNSGRSLQYADLWKYSPATGKWTQLASAFFGGYPAVGFSLNGKGYRMLPRMAGYRDSGVYEYNPVINAWTRKKRFPGIADGSQMGFVVNGRAFVTGGLITKGYSAETWELIP